MMMHGHRHGPMGMPPHRPPILPVGSIRRMNYLLRGGCCGCGGCLMTVIGALVFMMMAGTYLFC